MIDNDIISIQVEREIVRLYKSFLAILEQTKVDHKIMTNKINKYTSPDFAENIDYLTKERQEATRKLVLDNGNDSARSISAFLNMFDFKLNEEKVKQASEQKRVIVKRFTKSMPISELE